MSKHLSTPKYTKTRKKKRNTQNVLSENTLTPFTVYKHFFASNISNIINRPTKINLSSKFSDKVHIPDQYTPISLDVVSFYTNKLINSIDKIMY